MARFRQTHGQNIVFDDELGGIRYSRALISVPDSQKINVAKVEDVLATPWTLHEHRREAPVLDKKEVAANLAAVDPTPGVRDVYIKQADLDQFGFSPNCRKCSSTQLTGKAPARCHTHRLAGHVLWKN